MRIPARSSSQPILVSHGCILHFSGSPLQLVTGVYCIPQAAHSGQSWVYTPFLSCVLCLLRSKKLQGLEAKAKLPGEWNGQHQNLSSRLLGRNDFPFSDLELYFTEPVRLMNTFQNLEEAMGMGFQGQGCSGTRLLELPSDHHPRQGPQTSFQARKPLFLVPSVGKYFTIALLFSKAYALASKDSGS